MSIKSDQSISEKIAMLDELVAWFESDDFELEKALDKFSEADALARSIEQDITDFKNKINVLKQDFSKE